MFDLKKTLGKERQIKVRAERERLPPGGKRKHGKKRFGIMLSQKEMFGGFVFGPSYHWYATEKQRDDALESLSHNRPWAILSKVER